jgi:hypothetical protein
MKTDTLVDMEKINEQLKQELVAEMRMQNMQMQRWCCHQMVLSPMSNRASPSLATLKRICASADVGLIDGTVELAMEVRCDDRTHEDLIGILNEPTHCGLWITWRRLQSVAALGLVHPEETTLQTVPIHEDCVVVEVITIYTISADELLEYPPNDEVMKIGQAQGQRLQWRRCQIDIKEHQHLYLVHRLLYRFLVVHTVQYMFLPQMVPLLLLFNPHTFRPYIRKVHKIFHPHLLLVLKKQKNLHPHIRKRHQIFHPHHHAHHLLLLLLMKQQNLHPQTEVLKTIMPKQVHLGLIPL